MKFTSELSVKKALVLFVGFALLTARASAQMLTAAGSSLGVTSISTAGDDGYIFFSPSNTGGSFTDLASAPTYATLGGLSTASPTGTFSSTYLSSSPYSTFAPASGTVNGSNRYSNPYTALTINSTAYHTGIDYSNHQANSSSSPIALGAIQFNSSVPANVQVGFLLDTTGGGTQYIENVTLTLETSAGVAIGSPITLESTTPSTPANNFYFANVSNAVTGDLLVLTAYNTNSGTADTEVSGITFATLTPEPSTWALLGVSLLGGIAFLAKRRRSPSDT